MEKIEDSTVDVIWKTALPAWLVLIAMLVLLIFVIQDSLAWMVNTWENREEYGYGYLIPFITLFLIWQKKPMLEKMRFQGSWIGVFVVFLGMGLYFVGTISTIHTINQYAFVIAILGIAWAFMGWQAFRVILIPMLLLFFMIPLPNFLLNNLSAELQLISSQLGVWVIRLFDISVYLEGNVIDLGTYKLQVVEACSGLNYLFPLMSLSFIMAYLYRAPFWKRAILFISSMPITIMMNSFRIGMIGVLVEYWGVEQAEGFLHSFEGWVIFMASLGILILEMWLLGKIGRERQSLGDSFYLDFPEPTPEDAQIKKRKVPAALLISLLLISVSTAGASLIDDRIEIIPDRQSLNIFPLKIGNWEGKRDELEKIYIDVLKFEDYFIGDYTNSDGNQVNLYIAYYESQRAGESAHSPRTCIPGGGWQIRSHQVVSLDLNGDGSSILPVNRLLIQKGEHKQLVYYWFDQRGRKITNEYLVKGYLFWDALTRNRTDGALIRLTTFVKPGEDLDHADSWLTSFARDVNGHLAEYIPN